ncbi:MAG: ATP-binding cassette domain-containing protein [Dysosmobacter welbionis]
MNGTLELPVLLMAAMFSFTIFGSVESINDAAHILSVTDSVLDRLEELEGTELPDQDGKDISLEHYDICFDHVSFGYGTREVITALPAAANSGTAIVGPSGSGKSTLCALLARFYDGSGRITGRL